MTVDEKDETNKKNEDNAFWVGFILGSLAMALVCVAIILIFSRMP